jgi:hypothetical protein
LIEHVSFTNFFVVDHQPRATKFAPSRNFRSNWKTTSLSQRLSFLSVHIHTRNTARRGSKMAENGAAQPPTSTSPKPGLARGLSTSFAQASEQLWTAGVSQPTIGPILTSIDSITRPAQKVVASAWHRHGDPFLDTMDEKLETITGALDALERAQQWQEEQVRAEPESDSSESAASGPNSPVDQFCSFQFFSFKKTNKVHRRWCLYRLPHRLRRFPSPLSPPPPNPSSNPRQNRLDFPQDKKNNSFGSDYARIFIIRRGFALWMKFSPTTPCFNL